MYIWVFHDRRCCQIIWQIFTWIRAKKYVKNCPQWGLKPGPLDLQDNALPTELGRNLLGRRFLKWALFVVCTTSHVGLCSFLECWLSSVGKALAWRSGGPGFKPHWGQFLINFFALPRVKICQIIWQKRLSWKTQSEQNVDLVHNTNGWVSGLNFLVRHWCFD